MFPYGWSKEQLVNELGKHGLEQVLYNLPAGDWKSGERGIACLPGREGEFQEGVGTAIEYAKALKCYRLNCLVGKVPQGIASHKVRQTLVSNLRFAAMVLEKEKIRLLIESLNSQDIPEFYLVHTQDALQLFKEIGHPNLWLQYDIYHMQVMEGNLTKTIRNHLPQIAHIQIADNRDAMNQEPGKSILRTYSGSSTKRDMQDGSAVNTSLQEKQKTVFSGSNLIFKEEEYYGRAWIYRSGDHGQTHG